MKRARDAKTGKWVSIQFAKDNPDTTVVEEHPDYEDIKATKERK